MTPADASQLESDLVGDPHKVGARTSLISYYYQKIETSRDASLIGVTAELLVEEIGLLRPPEKDTSEMINSADFGKRLLEPARSLEPGNPRWRQ